MDSEIQWALIACLRKYIVFPFVTLYRIYICHTVSVRIMHIVNTEHIKNMM